MRFSPTLLLALALSLPAVAVEGAPLPLAASPCVATPDDLFPAPSGPLEILLDDQGDGPSFMKLVRRYGELTGQHVVFRADTKQALEEAKVQLDRPLVAEVGEVQRTFEVLLRQGDFSLEIESESAPRILRIRSLQTAERGDIRSTCRLISMEQIDVARRHPALLFSVTIDMPNNDTRQLSNSLRSLITDSNTCQMLPVGNSQSVIVSGFGDWLYEQAKTLRSIEEAAARRRAERERAVIVLSSSKAVEVAQVLTEAFTDRALPEGQLVKIRANEETNSILLDAPARRIAPIRRVIEALDR